MSEVVHHISLEVEVNTNKRTRARQWVADELDGLVEELAHSLFLWNTPGDPYFVIQDRTGDFPDDEDPYVPIVRAVLNALIHGEP